MGCAVAQCEGAVKAGVGVAPQMGEGDLLDLGSCLNTPALSQPLQLRSEVVSPVLQ